MGNPRSSVRCVLDGRCRGRPRAVVTCASNTSIRWLLEVAADPHASSPSVSRATLTLVAQPIPQCHAHRVLQSSWRSFQGGRGA
jgi:hypothetical protein